MPCIVAIDCTHVGSAATSLKDLVTLAHVNSTNQTADVLVEDQLQPPLDMRTVSQGREIHKPNSRTVEQVIHSA